MYKTTLTGNIGNDAEVKSFENGQSVITFSVAHTEKWKDKQGVQQEKTEWIRCQMWKPSDKLTIAQYLKKGTKLLIEGRVSASSWIDNSTGTPIAKSQVELNVSNLEFMSAPQVATQTNVPAPVQNATPVQTQPLAQTTQINIAQPSVADVNNPDMDLPFN